MCGIVAILGKTDVAPRLLEGLKRLEYRGYDSAGIATLDKGEIVLRRTVGKLKALEESLAAKPLPGKAGIGHTRWATHGAPSVRNAHPHVTDTVAIVHNGIIENFAELRSALAAQGHVFASQTDSETIAHLISSELAKRGDPVAAFEAALKRLEGAFAVAAIVKGEEDLLLGARRGSPLALGLAGGEAFLGSDAIALAPFLREVTYLEDGDWVALTRTRCEIHDLSGARVQRAPRPVTLSAAMIGKGEYRHFMAKEIHEQPEAIAHVLADHIDPAALAARPMALPFDWRALSRLTIAGCGSCYYAALTGKYAFEEIARLPVEVDIGSEFRYRAPPLPEGGAALFISQSGETADTLAALRYCKEQGQHIVSIVNVPESSIARESELVIPTKAGLEIAVCSTKATTAQMAVLAALALAAGRARGAIDGARESDLARHLLEAPRLMAAALQQEKHIAALAQDLAKKEHALFVGRGAMFALALEGALKLKEISYIHAEGYPGGEFKHGPLALVDDAMTVVALVPSGPLFEKMSSNVKEIAARGARILLVSDRAGIDALGDDAAQVIEVPRCPPLVAPLVYALPLQLLAYHTAVAKGTDVDQPRNLAKSVTVE